MLLFPTSPKTLCRKPSEKLGEYANPIRGPKLSQRGLTKYLGTPGSPGKQYPAGAVGKIFDRHPSKMSGFRLKIFPTAPAGKIFDRHPSKMSGFRLRMSAQNPAGTKLDR